MVKATELRIGNYLRDKKKVIKVTAPILQMIIDKQAQLKPIELNPQILEKTGFKKVASDNLQGWLTYSKDNKVYLNFGAGGFHFNHGKTISVFYYVHELQNLQFVLTGEELKIRFK